MQKLKIPADYKPAETDEEGGFPLMLRVKMAGEGMVEVLEVEGQPVGNDSEGGDMAARVDRQMSGDVDYGEMA